MCAIRLILGHNIPLILWSLFPLKTENTKSVYTFIVINVSFCHLPFWQRWEIEKQYGEEGGGWGEQNKKKIYLERRTFFNSNESAPFFSDEWNFTRNIINGIFGLKERKWKDEKKWPLFRHLGQWQHIGYHTLKITHVLNYIQTHKWKCFLSIIFFSPAVSVALLCLVVSVITAE